MLVKTIRFVSVAITSVSEVSQPSACVPPKSAETKNHKSGNQHQGSINDADAGGMNGSDHGVFHRFVFDTVLFIIYQEPDGDINGNSQGNTENQYGGGL